MCKHVCVFWQRFFFKSKTRASLLFLSARHSRHKPHSHATFACSAWPHAHDAQRPRHRSHDGRGRRGRIVAIALPRNRDAERRSVDNLPAVLETSSFVDQGQQGTLLSTHMQFSGPPRSESSYLVLVGVTASTSYCATRGIEVLELGIDHLRAESVSIRVTQMVHRSSILIRAQPCYVSTNACRLHHFRREISSSACIGL